MFHTVYDWHVILLSPLEQKTEPLLKEKHIKSIRPSVWEVACQKWFIVIKVNCSVTRACWWNPIVSLSIQIISYEICNGFLCFVLLWLYHQFLLDSFDKLLNLPTRIHQLCFTGTGAILWLPHCQWSKAEGLVKYWILPNHNKMQPSLNCVHNQLNVL